MLVNGDHDDHRISSLSRFRIPLRLMALLCLLAGVGLASLTMVATDTATAAQNPARIDRVSISGTITSVTHDYVDRAIAAAQGDGAQALLIELHSAGGDASAADNIVAAIRQSPVPVIVYVPPGDTVKGAAVTVLVAGHVAAMAPDATIGDASRVHGGGNAQVSDADARSQLADLARDRGRIADWTTNATQDNLRISADQAQADGIVDVVAADRDALLSGLDGRTVELDSGQRVTLTTANAGVNSVGMTTSEQIRSFLTSPSVAYVLLCFGVLGIFLELASPGGFIAGTIGVVCFGVGIYAFSNMPINEAGFGLMALAFVLLGLDLFVTSFGVLTVGGLAAFIGGSYIVIDTDIVGYDPVSRPVIWTATACVIAFAAFIGLTAIRSLRAKPVTGEKAMIGEIGTVREALAPDGMVFVMGELWQARAIDLPQGELIPVGASVEVIGLHGLLLDVRPAPDGAIDAERARRNLADARRVLPVGDGEGRLRP